MNTLSAISADDWRKEIIDYLKDPSKKVERRIRFQATKYVLLEDELYYRTIDIVLLKCLGDDEAKSLTGEIHEGVYGAHQLAFKMKWVIRRNGYYWPTILEDCFKCNTPGVCHLLSTMFGLKHDKFNGNKEVKINL